jgi:membrane protein required for colicin V production
MTTADFVILAIVLASGLLAMMRGLTQELLSIVAFVGAALLALWAEHYIRPLLGDSLPKGWAGTGMVVLGCFFAALLPLWILSGKLSAGIRQSRVGAIDRTAGFAFGALRGLFILAVAFIIFKDTTGGTRNLPDWVTEARLMPVVEKTANLIAAILPEEAPLGREALSALRKSLS